MFDIFVAEEEADTQIALLKTCLLSWRETICVWMNIYERAGFQPLVKTFIQNKSGSRRTLRNAPSTVFALPPPSICCTLSLAAPLVTTWPLLGSLGARLLNWFQQHQEPERRASNLSLDYGTLTPLSLEASLGL